MSARPLEEIVLPGVPGLGGLYARGVGASGRLALAARRGQTPRTLPDVAYLVADVRAGAAHLTAYQHLLGESASDVLPAGFVHVLAFPVATAVMVRRGFPLPLVGLVHLANRIDQLRPITLDDTLDVRAWAEHLAPHRTGTQVELVTEVRIGGPGHELGAGPLAWRGVSTYLAKGVRVGSGPARGPGDTAHDAGGWGEPGPALAGLDEPARVPFVPPVPTGRWELTADTGRRYAAVSGDRNPIHLSAAAAKAFGFPRTIAHGMFTASRALADVGAVRGDAFTWTVEFASPVLLPGTVTVRVAREDDHVTYAGWDARTGKRHLSGAVTPHV